MKTDDNHLYSINRLNKEEWKPMIFVQKSNCASATAVKTKVSHKRIIKPFESTNISDMYPLTSAKKNISFKENKALTNTQTKDCVKPTESNK